MSNINEILEMTEAPVNISEKEKKVNSSANERKAAFICKAIHMAITFVCGTAMIILGASDETPHRKIASSIVVAGIYLISKALFSEQKRFR